jgi:hypothetical protein
MWETALLRELAARSRRAGDRCGISPTLRTAQPQRVRRCPAWETALLCWPPGAAAGAPVQVWETALLTGRRSRSGRAGAGVGNSPTYWPPEPQRARRCPVWETALLTGRRTPQRARRCRVWETALLSGPPDAAAGSPVPGVRGNSPTCWPPDAAAGAPVPGVGNSPTLRAAGRRSRRAGARCGKQPYFADRRMQRTPVPGNGKQPYFADRRTQRAYRCQGYGKQPYFAGRRTQRARRCRVWETALLSGPPDAAAGAPVPGMGNSPTFRAAGRSGRASAGYGKQPYFADRRTQRAHRCRCGKQPYFAGRLPDAAVGAPVPGVGNSPTLRAAGRCSGRAGARRGETALLFKQGMTNCYKERLRVNNLVCRNLLFLMDIKGQLAIRFSLVRYT